MSYSKVLFSMNKRIACSGAYINILKMALMYVLQISSDSVQFQHPVRLILI